MNLIWLLLYWLMFLLANVNSFWIYLYLPIFYSRIQCFKFLWTLVWLWQLPIDFQTQNVISNKILLLFIIMHKLFYSFKFDFRYLIIFVQKQWSREIGALLFFWNLVNLFKKEEVYHCQLLRHHKFTSEKRK